MPEKRTAEESPTTDETKRPKSVSKYDEKILTTMVYYNYVVGANSVKVAQIEKECGVGQRTMNFRDAWKDLIALGHIVKDHGGDGYEFQLSPKGEALAATYDSSGDMKPPATSQDFVVRLKSKLKGKGPDILDLFLKHGSMTRKEAAGALGCNDRSHNFSYGLQSLKIKKKEYLVPDPAKSSKGNTKLVLTKRAFFTTKDYEEYMRGLESNSFPPVPFVEHKKRNPKVKEIKTEETKVKEEEATVPIVKVEKTISS